MRIIEEINRRIIRIESLLIGLRAAAIAYAGSRDGNSSLGFLYLIPF
jgi:hypothetical protein